MRGMASGWDSVGAVSHPFNEVLDEKATEKASRIKKQVSLAAAAAAEPLPWEAVAAKLAEDVEDEQKTEGGFRSGGDSRDGVRQVAQMLVKGRRSTPIHQRSFMLTRALH